MAHRKIDVDFDDEDGLNFDDDYSIPNNSGISAHDAESLAKSKSQEVRQLLQRQFFFLK